MSPLSIQPPSEPPFHPNLNLALHSLRHDNSCQPCRLQGKPAPLRHLPERSESPHELELSAGKQVWGTGGGNWKELNSGRDPRRRLPQPLKILGSLGRSRLEREKNGLKKPFRGLNMCSALVEFRTRIWRTRWEYLSLRSPNPLQIA